MGAEFEINQDPCIDELCAFRIINGGLLALISFCGVFLNLLVMYLILGRKVRLSNQKIFIFNLAISDLLIAIVGMFRGLGILDEVFIGVWGGEATGWCSAYLLFMMFVSYSNCPCMVALTLDRLVAICRPFKHRTLFTKKFCVAICVMVWLPQVIFYCWFAISMSTDPENFSMDYYPNYHRCQNTYKNAWLRTARFVSLVWAPFGSIIFMYIVIVFKVIKSGATSKRLLAISTVIIISGAICWLPSIISSVWTIPMNYKVAQVLTVTLFYVNSSTDPLVYVLLMPAVKRWLVIRFIKCESPDAISESKRFSTASHSARVTSTTKPPDTKMIGNSHSRPTSTTKPPDTKVNGNSHVVEGKEC